MRGCTPNSAVAKFGGCYDGGMWSGGFYYIYLSPNDKVNSCHAVTRSFALLSFPEFFFQLEILGVLYHPLIYSLA